MADILAVGAHPDDVEISIGGTLVKMKEAGYSIVICHCTDGEPTPYGTREAREVDFIRLRQRLAEGARWGEALIREVAPWVAGAEEGGS